MGWHHFGTHEPQQRRRVAVQAVVLCLGTHTAGPGGVSSVGVVDSQHRKVAVV